jgi:hypothetical protein
MSTPTLLVVSNGQYKEAELQFDKDNIGNSIIPKKNGQSFGIKALLPVGVQEKLESKGVRGNTDVAQDSLENLLEEAKERIRDMGAEYFVAGLEVNQYDATPARYAIIVGKIIPGYDFTLRLQAYIKKD